MNVGYPLRNPEDIKRITENKPLTLGSVLTYLSTSIEGSFVISDEEITALKQSIYGQYLSERFPNENPHSIKISPYFPQEFKEVIQITLSTGEIYLLEINTGRIVSIKEYKLSEKMLKNNVLVSALFSEMDQHTVIELRKLINKLTKSTIFQCGLTDTGKCIVIFETPKSEPSQGAYKRTSPIDFYREYFEHTYIIDPKTKTTQKMDIVSAERKRDGGSTTIQFANEEVFSYEYGKRTSTLNGKALTIL